MFAIDFNQVEDAPDFAPLPIGEYAVSVEDAEQRVTQAGGTGINVKLQVLEGPYKGRYVFDFLNVSHPDNPPWLNISLSRLKQLVTSCGIDTSKPFTDVSVLKGQCVSVRLGIDKRDTSKNTTNAYSPLKAAAKPAATQANNITAGGPSWG